MGRRTRQCQARLYRRVPVLRHTSGECMVGRRRRLWRLKIIHAPGDHVSGTARRRVSLRFRNAWPESSSLKVALF